MLLTVKHFQQNNFACKYNNPNILTCHKPLQTNENENAKRTTMRKSGKFHVCIDKQKRGSRATEQLTIFLEYYKAV